MIASQHEYEAVQRQLQQLGDWLERLQREHPNPEKGITKAGIRKMIARLHEESGIYEGNLAVAAASDASQTPVL